MLKSIFDSVVWTPDFRRICLSVLLFFSAYHLLTPVMPLYFKALGFDGEQIGLLVASFMGASLLIRPLVGKYADELSKKRLMAAGLGLFVLCPLLYDALTWPPALWAARILHGAGFALFYTVCSSWVTQIVPLERKAEGISHYSNAIKVAMGFAPGLGLWLAGSAARDSFHTVFWISSGLSLATFALLWKIKEPEARARSKTRGKLLNASAIFPGTVMATNSLAFGALIPFVSLLSAEKGLHEEKIFYTVYAFFLIFSRGFAGKHADARGRDAVIIPGMAVVALSLGLFAVSRHPIVFIATAGLYGLGAGLVQPALMALAADRSPRSERGSAMATFTLLNDLGIATGSYVMGRVGAVSGYGHALLVISITTFLGLAFFWARRHNLNGLQAATD